MKKLLLLIFLFIPFVVEGQIIRSSPAYNNIVAEEEPPAGSTLLDGLIAYWSFEEASGTIYDATDNNYDGSPENTPTFQATGKIGYAISLADASSEYIDFGTSFWDPGTSDWSVSFWVYRTAISNADGVIGNWGSYPYWYMRVDENVYGVLNFADLNIEVQGSTHGAIPATTWHHIVFTVDRSGMAELYIDGVWEDGNGADISAHSAVNVVNGNTMAIGRIGDDLEGYYFGGRIDEIAIYNRVLYQAGVDSLNNSGNGITYPFTP